MGTSNAAESIAVMAEPLFRHHRYTVYEYLRMAQAGVLAPDARVELIEGAIVDMPPIGSQHGWIVDTLTKLFIEGLKGKAIVRTQGAVQLDNYSEPQPDLAILRPKADGYRSHNPLGTETLLVVEVCDSSLLYDRQIKVPLYARHGVPEVWIVDVQDRQVHFFRSPAVDERTAEYTAISTMDRPGMVRVPGLTGVALDLSQLFA